MATVPADNLKVRFEDVLEVVTNVHPEADVEALRRAYVFSGKVHRGQERLSGEPYLGHPLAVARILAELQLDPVCVVVGLLHDVLEDTETSREDLVELFGSDVAELVDGVTKIGRMEYTSQEEEQAGNFRKLILAMVKDIRVLLVKLADRLHNMRTLEHLSAGKQRRIARETLEIYAPLAHRLGMGRIHTELQDLAFRYLEPEAHEELVASLEDRQKEAREFIDRVTRRIEEIVETEGIPCRVESRVKGLYSLHQKLQERDLTPDQVYDLVAFRIVTDTVRHCYEALGLVHQEWNPVPGRFKDFIALPKPNMYQSLHTTVMDQGRPFEVQIRSEEMHRIAEEGIAAHWLYKEGRQEGFSDTQAFQWLRQIVEWQREVPDPRDFLASLKLDLYPDEVYVFTPKGDVKALPTGATPIDFAYAIHTEVGHHCVGAKVNGKLVPLRTELRNGDIVEIKTNAESEPSRDWLRMVETSRARSKIRSYINKRERERSIELGRRLCEKEFRKHGLAVKKVLAGGRFEEVAPQFGLARQEDLLSQVGFGKISPRQILEKIVPPEDLGEEKPEPRRGRIRRAVEKALGFGDGAAVAVQGMDDILVYRARCCGPIPGEPIVGYITRGKGVSVHSAECPNVERLLLNSERRIPVRWQAPGDSVMPVKLIVDVQDRQGLLAALTTKIADLGTNIRHIESRMQGNGQGQIEVVVEVSGLKELRKVTDLLPGIKGVRAVRRADGGRRQRGR